MRKREILYSDIILHRFALLRQLKDNKARRKDTGRSWEELLNSGPFINNCESVDLHNTDEEVVHAIVTSNENITSSEVSHFMTKLHNFINELNIHSYEMWKGYCRKARYREGKKTIAIENSLLNEIATYLKAHHKEKLDPKYVGTRELQTAIKILLSDAKKCKKIMKNKPITTIKAKFTVK